MSKIYMKPRDVCRSRKSNNLMLSLISLFSGNKVPVTFRNTWLFHCHNRCRYTQMACMTFPNQYINEFFFIIMLAFAYLHGIKESTPFKRKRLCLKLSGKNSWGTHTGTPLTLCQCHLGVHGNNAPWMIREAQSYFLTNVYCAALHVMGVLICAICPCMRINLSKYWKYYPKRAFLRSYTFQYTCQCT